MSHAATHDMPTKGLGLIGAVASVFALFAILLTVELGLQAPRWIPGLTAITIGILLGVCSVPMSGVNIRRFIESFSFTLFLLGLATYTGLLNVVLNTIL